MQVTLSDPLLHTDVGTTGMEGMSDNPCWGQGALRAQGRGQAGFPSRAEVGKSKPQNDPALFPSPGISPTALTPSTASGFEPFISAQALCQHQKGQAQALGKEESN